MCYCQWSTFARSSEKQPESCTACFICESVVLCHFCLYSRQTQKAVLWIRRTLRPWSRRHQSSCFCLFESFCWSINVKAAWFYIPLFTCTCSVFAFNFKTTNESSFNLTSNVTQNWNGNWDRSTKKYAQRASLLQGYEMTKSILQL